MSMNGRVNYVNNYSTSNNINNNITNNNMINNGQTQETFYYLGQHNDGFDRHGPIIVYHYISETMRNGRNINTIDIWDYDLEFWPGDRYWRDAGCGINITNDV